MIGIRKLLDFVFAQRELKLLDDVMPDSTRRKEEELQEEEDKKAEQDNQLLQNASLGNVAIPLANGNILKIPVNQLGSEVEECNINITEQLAKSNAWKSIDQKLKTNPGNNVNNKETKISLGGDAKDSKPLKVKENKHQEKDKNKLQE